MVLKCFPVSEMRVPAVASGDIMLLIIKASSKNFKDRNEAVYGMKAQLLQEASYNLESGLQKFGCDEAGLLLLGKLSRQERHFFTGAKAAGTEKRSLNLNLLWDGAARSAFTVATQA